MLFFFLVISVILVSNPRVLVLLALYFYVVFCSLLLFYAGVKDIMAHHEKEVI